MEIKSKNFFIFIETMEIFLKDFTPSLIIISCNGIVNRFHGIVFLKRKILDFFGFIQGLILIPT